jgi:NarL family two-component system sensor histidine kinase LiaS
MRKIFRGLRWKLTMSYTVVTVATLLVVELLFIGGISFLVVNTDLLPNALVSAVDTFIVPQVAVYLDQPQPDIESLTRWLEHTFEEGLTFRSPDNPNVSLHLGDLDRDAILIVLDHNLDRITIVPDNAEGLPIGHAGALLAAAQRGETDPRKISQVLDGMLTTAVPVIDGSGNVLGVVMMLITYPPRGTLSQTLLLIGISIVVLTLTVGAIGTIFGYFTARGLTRRLNEVSQAADSWSQGDFSAFIQDRSADELGQLAEKLNRMAEQLQNLLQTQQELATLEERNRLARDLHDSVKQQIFASTMQVGAASALLDQDIQAAQKHLEEAERLGRQAQSELAVIIHELRPETLQDRGLRQALKDYTRSWSQLNNIHTEINIHGDDALPLEVEQALFRVTQEAFSNISRHSGASRVELDLSVVNNKACLTITDNGRGFDLPSTEGKGMGLVSMGERLAALGGSFSMESTPGQGTQLVACCYLINQELR